MMRMSVFGGSSVVVRWVSRGWGVVRQKGGRGLGFGSMVDMVWLKDELKGVG